MPPTGYYKDNKGVWRKPNGALANSEKVQAQTGKGNNLLKNLTPEQIKQVTTLPYNPLKQIKKATPEELEKLRKQFGFGRQKGGSILQLSDEQKKKILEELSKLRGPGYRGFDPIRERERQYEQIFGVDPRKMAFLNKLEEFNASKMQGPKPIITEGLGKKSIRRKKKIVM
jgi:hypothetical protein